MPPGSTLQLSRVLTSFVALALLSAPCLATELLVPEDYSLEEALAIAQPGDTVSVAPGTLDSYHGAPTIHLVDGITFLSRQPHTNRFPALLLRDLSLGVEVQGFDIGGDGGIDIIDSTVRFLDCRIEGIQGARDLGGGREYDRHDIPIVYLGHCSITFEQCVIRENYTGGVDGGYLSGIGPPPGTSASGSLRFADCLFERQSECISATIPLVIERCIFKECSGWFVIGAGPSLELRDSLVAGFRVLNFYDPWCYCYGLSSVITVGTEVTITGNTFVDTVFYYDGYCSCPIPTLPEIPAVIAVSGGATGVITHNLFIGQPGAALDAPEGVEVACNDAYQSADVNWRGGIGDVTGINGNISEQPLFCGRAAGDYTISIYSPASPENNDCGLMGAFDPVCEIEIPTARMGWGEFKARFGGNQ